MSVLVFLVAVLGSLAMPGVSHAEEGVLAIGYLELEGDPRYKKKRLEARFQGQPWGRPYAGAEVALKESRFAGAGVGVRFELRRIQGRDVDELDAALKRLQGEGVRFVLADLPDHTLGELAARVRGRELLLFNVSALGDALRTERCQANLLHLAPSQAMLMDALTQYLVSRKWRKVLVLEGPETGDTALLGAFRRSAKRYGLKIVAVRPFQLGTDPRQRQRNNVLLLTSGKDYDVVFVADTDGEFARAVPYQIQRPRPVVGAAGLVPDWWHWAWERHGAPQLNGRFLKKAKRLMTDYDWSAWMGVKVIVEAVLRTGSTDLGTLSAYIKGPDIVLDGFKGYRLSFRPWNQQLRQPLFLTTWNWVIARAPLQGFLHADNNLDTLGFDQIETACTMGGAPRP
jgi:ABC transporter substrate binding protein (PQQ-dependent alcohol dehydrogenase system)